MKAIISNGRRSLIFSNQLDFTELTSFVTKEFPRMKDTQLSFKDLQGNSVPIKSNEEIEIIKKMFSGQNFVELTIDGLKPKDHKSHKHGSCERKYIGHPNRKGRRTLVLSKVFGGEPKDYEQFESENVDIPLGILIKKYAQVNNIENFKEGTEKIPRVEKRRRVFEKIFGQAQSDKYEKFFEENEDLRLGQLIRKYCQVNGKTDFWGPNEQQCAKRKQRTLQKLSKFFGKPQEEFENLVNQNPGLKFRQLIKILIDKGVEVDQTRLQQFKEEQRKSRQSRKEKKHLEPKELKQGKELSSQSKPKSKSRCKGKKSQEKLKKAEGQINVQNQKGKNNNSNEKNENNEKNTHAKSHILKQMKELFGSENIKEYVKFINENYELGQVGIIQKWFDQTSQ